MQEFFTDWGGWIFGASVLMFLGSLWFVSWLIIRLPYDYFLTHNVGIRHANQLVHYLWLLVRNLFGILLIASGVAMLVLPGQGVITILLGLSLMAFPGKNRILRWILERKSVRKTMNWIRRKAKKPPLVFELVLGYEGPSNDDRQQFSRSRLDVTGNDVAK